ncbi:MAG: hypothetical protein M1276_02680 [Deltaproteobacteria bacterium]|jgi:hypothetical protein|nr:hypothetical protein [Deltaproteobacteria bacterium]
MAEPNIPSGGKNENADIEKQMMQTTVKPGIHNLPGHMFWKWKNNFVLGMVIFAIILSLVVAYLFIFFLSGKNIPLTRAVIKSLWLVLLNKKTGFIAMSVIKPVAFEFVKSSLMAYFIFIFENIGIVILLMVILTAKVLLPALAKWHVKLEADYDMQKTKHAKSGNITPTNIDTGLAKKEIDDKVNIDNKNDKLADL